MALELRRDLLRRALHITEVYGRGNGTPFLILAGGASALPFPWKRSVALWPTVGMFVCSPP